MREREIIEGLASLGLSRSDYHIVQILPLIQVAWAEGSVDKPERNAILQYMKKNHLPDSTVKHIDRWLSKQPTEDAYNMAHKLIVNLAHRYEGVDFQFDLNTIQRTLKGCNTVASTSGGFLGMGRTSAVEKAVIENITEAFQLLEPQAITSPHNRGGVGWATLTGEVDFDQQNLPTFDPLAEDDPEPAAEPEPATEPEPEPEPVVEPEAVEPAPEPVVELEVEPEPEVEPELVIGPEPESVLALELSEELVSAWEELVLLRRHRVEHARILPGSPALRTLDVLIREAELRIRGL
jgi:hypothetical protein